MTVKPLTPERLRAVDDLTDELCFGMWHNPREINDFLHAVLRLGGHPIFEFEELFAAQILLEPERARLPLRGLEIARFYRACLTLGAAMLNIDEMELAAQRVDDLSRDIPLFLDAFNPEAQGSRLSARSKTPSGTMSIICVWAVFLTLGSGDFEISHASTLVGTPSSTLALVIFKIFACWTVSESKTT